MNKKKRRGKENKKIRSIRNDCLVAALWRREKGKGGALASSAKEKFKQGRRLGRGTRSRSRRKGGIEEEKRGSSQESIVLGRR